MYVYIIKNNGRNTSSKLEQRKFESVLLGLIISVKLSNEEFVYQFSQIIATCMFIAKVAHILSYFISFPYNGEIKNFFIGLRCNIGHLSWPFTRLQPQLGFRTMQVYILTPWPWNPRSPTNGTSRSGTISVIVDCHLAFATQREKNHSKI